MKWEPAGKLEQLNPDVLRLRALQSDPAAFESLYREYYPRLYEFIVRILGRVDDVEETINDTMMVVWTAPEQPFQTQGAAASISVPLDRPQFRIVLEEDFALDAWLERYQARVIDGPSSIGVLTVDVAMASGNFNVVLNQIRADEQTIFVEAVDVIEVRPDRQR